MELYIKIITSIISQQQVVMGPLALQLASRIDGLSVMGDNIQITKEPSSVLTELVQAYAQLFGQASVEVCKDAVREIKPSIPHDQLPPILQ